MHVENGCAAVQQWINGPIDSFFFWFRPTAVGWWTARIIRFLSQLKLHNTGWTRLYSFSCYDPLEDGKVQRQSTQKESSILVQLPAPSTWRTCPLPDVDRRTVAASNMFEEKMPSVFLWRVLLNLNRSASFPPFSTLAPVIPQISLLSCPELLITGPRLWFETSNSCYFYIWELVHLHHLLAVNHELASQYADIWQKKHDCELRVIHCHRIN